jgi:hypothetical protein
MEIKDVLILIALLGVMVGGYAWHRRRLFGAGRSWKKLAERFGGTFTHDGEGWIKDPNYVMACEIAGIPLTLTYTVTSTGRSTSYYTRVTTPCDTELAFSVYQESVFQKISKQMGFQDVRVGDTEYDRTFMIKAADPESFRARDTPTQRKEHLRMPAVHVMAEDGRLGVVHGGLVSAYDQALALLELAAVVGQAFLDRPPDPEARH